MKKSKSNVQNGGNKIKELTARGAILSQILIFVFLILVLDPMNNLLIILCTADFHESITFLDNIYSIRNTLQVLL